MSNQYNSCYWKTIDSYFDVEGANRSGLNSSGFTQNIELLFIILASNLQDWTVK